MAEPDHAITAKTASTELGAVSEPEALPALQVNARAPEVERRPVNLPVDTPVSAAPARLDAPEMFINRELSWLEFNARVVAEASDEEVPLYERLKFLAI